MTGRAPANGGTTEAAHKHEISCSRAPHDVSVFKFSSVSDGNTKRYRTKGFIYLPVLFAVACTPRTGRDSTKQRGWFLAQVGPAMVNAESWRQSKARHTRAALLAALSPQKSPFRSTVSPVLRHTHPPAQQRQRVWRVCGARGRLRLCGMCETSLRGVGADLARAGGPQEKPRAAITACPHAS